ncbi:MAG TPA: NAD(P)/FAD-dependent oxidoreductase [Casimicrobiaceae bacterium]|nr:NAD(P)/FAD-dependent oxidoreductase [Casimicrobiaceae bacterium]
MKAILPARWTRRRFLKAGAASLVLPLGGRARAQSAAAKVVVVGGGYGGATAAKYVRMWSGGKIDVVLVEREAEFVSCPVSNLVIGGSRRIADVTVAYDGLDRWGVRRLRDEAIGIDPGARALRVASGASLPYDRLILSPGIDFMWEEIPSFDSASAREKVLHAWKAGPQTVALRKQLEAMPDGGLFAIHVPRAPYRCPPAPYERACQAALYFSTQKKKSKVLILDANEDVQSKKALFTAAWNGRYKGYIEYRPNNTLVDVDASTLTAKLDFEDVKADVLNVIPPQYAGAIARQLGMANANARFCQVDFLTYESTVQKNIHILGDSIQIAPLMPKSAHMANQHGKICAAAVVALLGGGEINSAPMFANACYSYISDKEAVHVATVHAYDREQKTMVVVPGSGGLSSAPSEQEGAFADAWARNIWYDSLG